MSLKTRLVKLLTLLSIAFYLAIKVSSKLIKLVDYYIPYISVFEHLILRFIICCMAIRYYFHLQSQESVKESMQLSTNGYRLTIGTILLQLIMSFSLLLLSSIKEALWGPSLQPILGFSSRIDFLWRGIIEITCMAAILEELLFRGILEKLLSKVTPMRLWITPISALIFSLMHGNMSNNLFYFVMGCFLSHLYHQTKNIIYPIIAHGLHNLSALSIIYFGLDERLHLVINSLPVFIRSMLTTGALLFVYSLSTYSLISKKTNKLF